MKIYATPDWVFRVARADGPWELAPWLYAPFDGRWDDPEQQYRVRYAGVGRFGAFVERLIRYRPSLDTLAAIAAQENGEAPDIMPGLPPDWFTENAIGAAAIDVPNDNGIVDLVTGDGMAAGYAAVEAARRRAAFALHDYDASTLLSGTPRRFTQALSRIIYDMGFAGIAYRSRFAPEEVCIALFESRHVLVQEEASTIAIDDEDLQRACDLHHLARPVTSPPISLEPAQQAAAAAPASTPATLRAQIHDVVYRLRALIVSYGPTPTDDQEGDMTVAFSNTLAEEVHALRARIRNFTGVTPAMRTLISIMPIGEKRLSQIADMLEQMASSVPQEALASPASAPE